MKIIRTTCRCNRGRLYLRRWLARCSAATITVNTTPIELYVAAADPLALRKVSPHSSQPAGDSAAAGPPLIDMPPSMRGDRGARPSLTSTGRSTQPASPWRLPRASVYIFSQTISEQPATQCGIVDLSKVPASPTAPSHAGHLQPRRSDSGAVRRCRGKLWLQQAVPSAHHVIMHVAGQM